MSRVGRCRKKATVVDRRSEEKQRRGTRSVWVSFPRLVLVFTFHPVCVVPRAQTRLALLCILSKFNLYLVRHTHNFRHGPTPF